MDRGRREELVALKWIILMNPCSSLIYKTFSTSKGSHTMLESIPKLGRSAISVFYICQNCNQDRPVFPSLTSLPSSMSSQKWPTHSGIPTSHLQIIFPISALVSSAWAWSPQSMQFIWEPTCWSPHEHQCCPSSPQPSSSWALLSEVHCPWWKLGSS